MQIHSKQAESTLYIAVHWLRHCLNCTGVIGSVRFLRNDFDLKNYGTIQIEVYICYFIETIANILLLGATSYYGIQLPSKPINIFYDISMRYFFNNRPKCRLRPQTINFSLSIKKYLGNTWVYVYVIQIQYINLQFKIITPNSKYNIFQYLSNNKGIYLQRFDSNENYLSVYITPINGSYLALSP